MKSWDTKADFDAAYSLRIARYREDYAGISADEPRGHYDRRTVFNSSSPYPRLVTIPQLDFVTPEWESILAHFVWPTSTNILIVGCGFGWTIEYLQSRGYASSWGTETSTYILAEKDNLDPVDGVVRSKESGRIHDKDISRSSNRGQLLRDTVGPGNRYDVIVSERVLSSLTDAEAISFRNDLDELRADPDGVIIHIENSQEPGPGMDPDMNFHTLAQWKALIPLDGFVRSGGGEFL